jgi:hypothetical protein
VLDSECAREVALVAAALARRHDVGDDRLRHRAQPAAAEALDEASGDELRHRLGERA